ncbi:alpha/beta hydrolase [Hassallia byssoidea VB512170]|uniref:Alpha/beta hydrolase n=1 Tax=Hassallia byssoidea VB512170 TaxID=1304833 RepID=A0A846H0V2_9CYAN|nr:alpha/beta hydrolase [Hassalia byssoidea VB512170]
MIVASLKAFSVVSVGVALIVWGTEKTATAATFNDAPLFDDVASYTTTISGNNNLADIYFPNPKDLKTGKYSFPIALLLQGGLVDKSNYSNYASIVAKYGFIVVVPNNKRLLRQFGRALAPQTSQVNAVLTQMLVENSNPTSPVRGIVNTQKLGLLGHSLGGAVGLSAITNLCVPTGCEGSFSRPKELVAGAFFGANLRDENDKFIPIKNSAIPIALLQGTDDGRALPFRAQATYDNIKDAPKALISIIGANHFGITNTNNPLGAVPDPNAPKIEQNVAVETIARWSGLFLRASVLNDKGAFDYIYSTGDVAKVTVISQTKPIPESSSTLSLLVLGAWSILLGMKKKTMRESQ